MRGNSKHHNFLTQMAECENFIFLPTVLETFSRICAEAKMLNLDVITNRKMIGFFSEDYSHLKGLPLIKKIQEQNDKALKYFVKIVRENT